LGKALHCLIRSSLELRGPRGVTHNSLAVTTCVTDRFLSDIDEIALYCDMRMISRVGAYCDLKIEEHHCVDCRSLRIVKPVENHNVLKSALQ
jgi:hypothetical protein